MARRKRLPDHPLEFSIARLDSRGRGAGEYEGRNCMIRGVLPGERVMAVVEGRSRKGFKMRPVDILEASADRVEPRCPHADHCSGCAIQQMAPDAQLELKEQRLLAAFRSAGDLTPESVFEPLRGPLWGYRRKARLSVRDVKGKQRVLVGFREPNGKYVADLGECHVLVPAIGERLPELSRLVGSLDLRGAIPQIEVACGDTQAAIVVRHVEPLGADDRQRLQQFWKQTGIAVYTQSGGLETIEPLNSEAPALSFRLPDYDVELEFEPADFVQVNGELNRSMVRRAIELLAPEEHDNVLDLFCGLGNFTLPLARRCGSVTGFEGDAGLVRRAEENARRNGISNAQFLVADLYQDDGESDAWSQEFSRVLIDPPRTGAGPVLDRIAATGATRVVYVSCHPESLADDALRLVQDHGFRVAGAGIMDMFPHTAHVESIALFLRD